MRHLPIILTIATTHALSSGCRSKPTPAESEPSPRVTSPLTAGAAGNEKPRSKATRAPEDSELGVLPPDVGIPVGAEAPNVSLHRADGSQVKLADLIAKGPVLLVFYRGGWCPYCNFQIRELTRAFQDFAERGVTPVAISVDRIEEAAKTRATYEIPFPVLSDPDVTAHEAFRVIHRAKKDEVAKLKSFGMDVERAAGRDHHQFAIPSVFLINRDGLVRWAHADADYKVRPTSGQLLTVVDRFGSQP